ncbi:hypothetical protein [Litchfieldia salsa]|uniref:Uncharacterized protein n=1 Tax=Litchfieldia salsa TaxID=930152 RepID=A0A1H0RWU6_9BACI|nr:hypothetical protein [Litchfieldia salsa]SDP33877.1 hypothetical protein SAMN05216565_102419 [Litchfieldia salsa]
MNPVKLILISSVITDIFLILFLSTMIEEIGIMFFLVIVLIIISGTAILFTILKKKTK